MTSWRGVLGKKKASRQAQLMFGDWSCGDDWSVGENTAVKMSWKEIIEGRVYAYDQNTNILVIRTSHFKFLCIHRSQFFSEVPLENNDRQFRFINTTCIEQTLLGTKQDGNNPLIQLPGSPSSGSTIGNAGQSTSNASPAPIPQKKPDSVSHHHQPTSPTRNTNNKPQAQRGGHNNRGGGQKRNWK